MMCFVPCVYASMYMYMHIDIHSVSVHVHVCTVLALMVVCYVDVCGLLHIQYMYIVVTGLHAFSA